MEPIPAIPKAVESGTFLVDSITLYEVERIQGKFCCSVYELRSRTGKVNLLERFFCKEEYLPEFVGSHPLPVLAIQTLSDEELDALAD